MRPGFIALAAATSLVGLTACGPLGSGTYTVTRWAPTTDGPVTQAGRSMALAYMKSHPVPPRPGMAAGILVSSTDYGGDTWSAFTMTVLTASGRTVVVSCGNPEAETSCPLQKGEVDLPDSMPNGMYLYVRSDGTGDKPGDYRLVSEGTVRLPQKCSAAFLNLNEYEPRYEKCVGRPTGLAG